HRRALGRPDRPPALPVGDGGGRRRDRPDPGVSDSLRPLAFGRPGAVEVPRGNAVRARDRRPALARAAARRHDLADRPVSAAGAAGAGWVRSFAAADRGRLVRAAAIAAMVLVVLFVLPLAPGDWTKTF